MRLSSLFALSATALALTLSGCSDPSLGVSGEFIITLPEGGTTGFSFDEPIDLVALGGEAPVFSGRCIAGDSTYSVTVARPSDTATDGLEEFTIGGVFGETEVDVAATVIGVGFEGTCTGTSRQTPAADVDLSLACSMSSGEETLSAVVVMSFYDCEDD